MRDAPDVLTETPFDAPAPGPAGLDVLSDALRVVRASGALLLRGDFSAPWALAAPESEAIARVVHPDGSRLVILHLVAEGRCWIRASGCDPVELEAGELVLFPRGHAHVLGWGDAAAVPVSALLPAPPWVDLPSLRLDGGGGATRIVCCYLRCDPLLFHPFLDGLPAVLRVRAEDAAAREWFRASVRYVAAEAARGGPGASALVARLTELLFLEAVRSHLWRMGPDEVGWLAALRDPWVSRALHALHARPAQGWSVAALAREVGLSRSALMARFRRLLSVSPMRYLALWRLQLASQRLHATADGLSEIATDVGYGSEVAFSHAFKRFTGVSPAAWRRARREPARPGAASGRDPVAELR